MSPLTNIYVHTHKHIYIIYIYETNANYTAGHSLAGLAGSPAYVAPEVLSENYSEKVDVWSAGILLHALLVGVLPFKGDSLDAVFEAIKNLKLDFHTGIWESVSKPARDLLERILTRDVSARITADEVLSKCFFFWSEVFIRILNYLQFLIRYTEPDIITQFLIFVIFN